MQTSVSTEKEWSLRTGLRRLWSDHVFWTREYILGAGIGTPNAEAAASRLLKNQEHIGDSIVPYYGRAAGDQLTGLLKQHILIAVDLVDGAKTGNQTKFNDADKRWYSNIEEIASFLSGANPNWPRKDVHDLLRQHLDLTKKETVAILNKNWAEAAATFDDIYAEILTLSDALSAGIVKQFHSRFT